jgi:hypothetical protein
MHPMELLGDVGHVEPRFGLFGDSVSARFGLFEDSVSASAR